jgi:hypothetical protein
MWISVNKLPAAVRSRKKTWTPNHFVTIIIATNKCGNLKDAENPKTQKNSRKPTYADIFSPPIQHKNENNEIHN